MHLTTSTGSHLALRLGWKKKKKLKPRHAHVDLVCPCSNCYSSTAYVYKLGHTLYTGATAWPLLVHYTGTAWPLLVHACITSLDTACILEGYCLGTFGTLYRATACAQLAHYFTTGLSITCMLPAVVHFCIIEYKM